MFGLFTSRSRGKAFANCVRRFHADTPAELLELDEGENIAFFRFPGEFEDYPLGLILTSSGRVMCRAISETWWRGRPPQLIYDYMEEMDKGSERVSFSVQIPSSGKSRCAATCLAPPPDEFRTETFLAAAKELLSAMYAVDKTLRKHGHA